MQSKIHSAIQQIDAQQWNRLVSLQQPFLQHAFLNGLEECGCVSQQTGWSPAHIAIYDTQKLLAAMPCYIKHHSYGEYIFDWAWADAYHRHGLQYYPKLSNAIPFTPATGERWLIDNNSDTKALSKQLFDSALALVKEQDLSSFHCLFNTPEQSQLAGQYGLSQRFSTQFHWHNQYYRDFEHFLAQMSSKKRKNIKRERRRVNESGVEYRWLSGDKLDHQALDTMYQFYCQTVDYYGGQRYLNRRFFHYLADHLSQHTLLLFAYYQQQVIAGGLYFKSDNTLYGRYWGAAANFHSLHFETCYYQAIEWCIENNYRCFEAGAQGEHKVARGLQPQTTYSNHWISHPQFRDAIDDFVKQEQQQAQRYAQHIKKHSPFKQRD